MKQGLLVFLAMCAFAIAMVPRDRRAANNYNKMESMTSEGNIQVCPRSTPCAWEVHHPISKETELNITNTYCSCGVGTACAKDEYDHAISASIYRCRVPGDHDERAVPLVLH